MSRTDGLTYQQAEDVDGDSDLTALIAQAEATEDYQPARPPGYLRLR
jgi:hypothetical protein